MRKLYYLVMISVASILTACENRSEEWDVVDFGNDCAVGLQEHLECRFIPLETKDSVLLKDLYRVCWVDDRIFVFDRSDEINGLTRYLLGTELIQRDKTRIADVSLMR